MTVYFPLVSVQIFRGDISTRRHTPAQRRDGLDIQTQSFLLCTKYTVQEYNMHCTVETAGFSFVGTAESYTVSPKSS
jgi:hypothetical protein